MCYYFLVKKFSFHEELCMKQVRNVTKIVMVFMVLQSIFCCDQSFTKQSALHLVIPMKIYLIVGSVRNTTTGKQIAKNIQVMLENRSDITTEIICIADYHVPFYTDEISPASRKSEIVDPVLKRWSDCIARAQGYILICPEYNGGYTASLKNALDSLYHEWNNKPVGIVGYSGGPSGGTCMIAQLQQVVARLEMISVSTSIKIPQSWKAFTQQGDFVSSSTIEKDLHTMLDEIVKARIV